VWRCNPAAMNGMMSLMRSQWPLSRRALAAALIAGAGLLAGCSGGSTISDHLPTALGGLPEGTPQRPTTASAYPAVHDMPPARPTSVLSDAEQTKLENDLVAARTRAAEAAKAAAAADKP
jgi:hypothetical protein